MSPFWLPNSLATHVDEESNWVYNGCTLPVSLFLINLILRLEPSATGPGHHNSSWCDKLSCFTLNMLKSPDNFGPSFSAMHIAACMFYAYYTAAAEILLSSPAFCNYSCTALHTDCRYLQIPSFLLSIFLWVSAINMCRILQCYVTSITANICKWLNMKATIHACLSLGTEACLGMLVWRTYFRCVLYFDF